MAEPKPKTRAALEAELADLCARLTAEIEKLRVEHATEYRHRQAAEAREKETRAQFADLKERLVNAEADNQRMRGYIDRVQEDDVVREELVKVGEPDGAQQLVPKRKPTGFHTPEPYHHKHAFEGGGYACATAAGADRHRPRHWVTY